ncbi:STAS domain-containing protein [Planococcus sp. YIM B11945]|uniref:STAS domain-containing protein n=1 Tax=Planococcus sp. YIM B11945 TaxID=3435410 RepID=UPI003D7E2295
MKEPQDYEEWPLPFFKLTRDFSILGSSGQALSLFGESPVFTGLLDEGSRQKAVEFLHPGQDGKKSVELTFQLPDGKLLLMDVYCKWQNSEIAHVIAIPKDRQFERVSKQLAHLRTRLNETNYDLLMEKERTDELLKRVQELSAPCIRLGRKQILIPMFGRIDPKKMEIITPLILATVYEADPNKAIFDLTAMDEICPDGLVHLHSLFQSLSIMGVHVFITGVQPKHAKRLHELNTSLHATFTTSLEELLSLNEIK